MSIASVSWWIQKLRSVILFAIFYLVFSAPPVTAGSSQGYINTINLWQEVRGKTVQYRLLLQNLYAEVEVAQRQDRSRTNAEFARRLSRDYPGSTYFSGSHGKLAVNNYTIIYFDSSWNINQLTQKFGSLEKSYDFRNNTFSAIDGPNKITLRLDLQRPEKSLFTGASIPAISVNAEQVWARRKPTATSRFPLKDLLNDVYAHRLAGGGTRMDKLAEELVSNPSSRANVLETAGELYASNLVGKAGKGTPSKSISNPSPQGVKIPSPSSLLAGVLKTIPWYGYLILFFALALRIATPKPGKIALLKLLLQYLMSQKKPEQSRDKVWVKNDIGKEDWLGNYGSQSESHSGKPEDWTPQVLSSLEWKRFETVCAEYLRMIGYDPRETRIGADGGVDIWVYKAGAEKPVGLVQCKAWTTYKVGVKPVRELFGVMAAEGIANGKFITSGQFTSEALQFADGKKLQLISGEMFIAAIKKLPAEKQAELLKLALAGDYRTPTCPQCGTKMKLRHGENPGRKQFWGCIRFPNCRATLVYKGM